MEPSKDTLSKEVAADLYRFIKWLPLRMKVTVVVHLVEMLLDEKKFINYEVNRLINKHKK